MKGKIEGMKEARDEGVEGNEGGRMEGKNEKKEGEK